MADLLDWETDYEEVLKRDSRLEWFDGGTLNASNTCIGRHLDENKVAIRWAGADGASRIYTYLDLHREVNEAASTLRSLGVAADDIVTIYLPVMPQLPIPMLACTRLGALHNVVFAGFSTSELAVRLERTDSAHRITCNGYYHQGDAVAQKNKAYNACLDSITTSRSSW